MSSAIISRSPNELASVLGKFPRLRLGNFPSPVRMAQLPDGSTFAIKDDGACSPVYGGNKIRKLEFLLAEALQAPSRILVCHGDFESHTVQASSLLARKADLAVHAVVFAHRGQSMAAPELQRLRESQVFVHRASSMPAAILRAHYLSWRHRAFLIPLGATTPLSTLGYVQAALELEEQVMSGLIPEPSHIVIPFATCGSVAGLLIGLAHSHLKTRVIAVQSVERIIANRRRLETLVGATLKLLGKPSRMSLQCLQKLEGIDSLYLGNGYRASSCVIEEALTLAAGAGLRLEAAFSGKAFASLLSLLREDRAENVLFWNTHDQTPACPAPMPSL